jgi:hypothetical protein
MIVFLKDPKDSSKKLLDLINTFSNVVGYKINIEKSVSVLYTNNNQAEKQRRKTNPFTVASRIKLTKNVKNLYNGNSKILKKTPEDRNTFHIHKLGKWVSTESNLQIQWNSHQNPNIILHRNITINTKILSKT